MSTMTWCFVFLAILWTSAAEGNDKEKLNYTESDFQVCSSLQPPLLFRNMQITACFHEYADPSTNAFNFSVWLPNRVPCAVPTHSCGVPCTKILYPSLFFYWPRNMRAKESRSRLDILTPLLYRHFLTAPGGHLRSTPSGDLRHLIRSYLDNEHPLIAEMPRFSKSQFPNMSTILVRGQGLV